MRTLSVAASYYFMRNVKDVDFVGHEEREHCVLVGFAAAF
jgi:hypothetical protein